MPSVVFQHRGGAQLRVNAAEGERLMDVARRGGIAVDAPCNGSGLCGKCRMRLIYGDVRSSRSRHLSEQDYMDGWRLACETRILGDITVEVPESAFAFQRGIHTVDLSDPKTGKVFNDVRKLLNSRYDTVSARMINMDAPTLEDTRPDRDRLCDAVEAETGIRPMVSLTALKKLPTVMRSSDFSICAIIAKDRILDVFGSEPCRPLGVAIDIGTTTVSAVLVDLENGEPLSQISVGNGQIPYGADVINRIIESTREGGRERLKKAIVDDTLSPLIKAICANAGEDVGRIYRVSVAGNTTMEHLLLGLEADPIRIEPYIPAFFGMEPLRASDVIPGLNPEATLLLAPNVGSYVGGDITAGVYAAGVWNTDLTTLFIDLGTNGEMVIGNREYMMTCACSAGPAFEGGDISCGMRATEGAVDAAEVDAESMEPSLHVIGAEGQKPRGLCGSGLIDLTAALFRAGIISPNGKFIREGSRVRVDEYGMGRYVFAFPEESAEGKELSLNEVDIDNLIRAKGAIFSAICLLSGQLGLKIEDIDEILIAGGIGGGINFRSAITIGMLPDVPEERFRYMGNTSLSGAYASLLSDQAAMKINDIGNSMMYVELSSEPGYMDEFVSACFLPHTNRGLFPSVE